MPRFLISSVAAFLLDAALLWLFQGWTGHLLMAVVLARVISASVNFTVNRWWVFAAGWQPLCPALRRYAGLAVVLLAANYVVLRFFVDLGTNVVVAKVVTEASLFVASFLVQRMVVFARRRHTHAWSLAA